jgi:hypothetical protein
MSLTMLDIFMKEDGSLPSSARLTPAQAERVLWQALSERKMVAEGFDRNGSLVEIPAREWTHLKLFEERGQDVFKYEPLDREGPYTKVRFLRSDLILLWPCYKAVDVSSLALGAVSDVQLEPMAGSDSHVPLSVAICWLMTDGGVSNVPVRDTEAWKLSVDRLMPRISGGNIEIIGCDENLVSSVLPAAAFASIDVEFPLTQFLSNILVEDTHICCHFYMGQEAWKNGSDDQLFVQGCLRPKWVRLQVRREHVLKFWPRPSATAKSQVDCRRWLVTIMRESPRVRPKPKLEYQKEAMRKFPALSVRQFQRAWDAAIEEATATGWCKAGRPKGNQITA